VRETAGLGVLFAVLVAASACVAAALLHADGTRSGWRRLPSRSGRSSATCSRSVAVPFDREDVGNWLEPLVLVALFIETSVLALSAYALGVAGDRE
jgi:hypothetical protein